MRSKIPTLFCAAFTALLASGCNVELSYFDKDRAHAEAAVSQLRAAYRAGDYKAIYAMGAPGLKQAVSEAALVAGVSTSAERYGALKYARQATASCFANEVRFIYLSEFEKGPATEMMIWQLHDGQAYLMMYKISPGLVEVTPNAEHACPPAAVL
ncbi:MAG: hypothetical protein ACJ8GW_10115 [Massilia sp.]